MAKRKRDDVPEMFRLSGDPVSPTQTISAPRKRRAPTHVVEAGAPVDRKPKQDTYAVDMATITHDDIARIGSGDLDRAGYSRADFESFMRILAVLRSHLWKLDAAWYTKIEAISVQQFVTNGARPSHVAKALAGASLDPYWRSRRWIPFLKVLEGFGAFVTQYNDHALRRAKASGIPDGVSPRSYAVERLRAAAKRLGREGPFYASRFEHVDTSRLSNAEIAALADEAESILAEIEAKKGARRG